MANRRMFSLDVVDTDLFLEMPISSQALYFHLGMRADDDGFVASPNKIIKLANCAKDDMNVLISRGFVIQMGERLIVIRHWKQNNFLRSDRHKKTIYQTELLMLTDNGGIYELKADSEQTLKAADCVVTQMVDKTEASGIPTVNQRYTQDSIGKDSLGKVSKDKDSTDPPPDPPKKKRTVFIPPTPEEVEAYCKERGNGISGEAFCDYYEARGWILKGGEKMKDWRATVRTWERNRGFKYKKPGETKPSQGKPKSKFNNCHQRKYDYAELEKKLYSG